MTTRREKGTAGLRDTKRGQNEGSWRERDGKWQLRVTIAGQQRAFTGATKDAARAKADKARAEHRAGARAFAGVVSSAQDAARAMNALGPIIDAVLREAGIPLDDDGREPLDALE
jgi:hypothetical protein